MVPFAQETNRCKRYSSLPVRYEYTDRQRLSQVYPNISQVFQTRMAVCLLTFLSTDCHGYPQVGKTAVVREG